MPAASSMSAELRHKQVLVAIVEALLPPQAPPPSTSALTPLERRYWEYNLATDAVYIDTVQTAIAEKMTSYDKTAFTLLLTLLSTSLGTSLLFGTTPSLQSFDQWTVTKRIEQLQQLQHSAFVARRKIFIGLKKFLCGVAFSYTDNTQSSVINNPYWDAMGFPGSPMQWQVDVIDQEQVAQAVQRQAPVRAALNASHQYLQASASSSSSTTSTTMECDVVIVGSGSGGSVAASVLAQAGWKVVVLEKSCYKSPDTISLNEAVAMDEQYEQHGLLQTTSGVVSIMAGSAVGGGTAINWSCCLALPDYVKKEWTDVHGILNDATEYNASLAHVMQTLGATDTAHVTHNAMNLKLQEGCDALQYEWSVTGQNLRDPGDVAAGYMGMGDRYGNKNGAVQTFLLDAIQKGGAQIVENCRVDRIMFTKSSGTSKRRATGVECTILSNNGSGNDQKLVVHARQAVIVSAGALHTPIILQKSGLRNRHIGRHLRLHPVTGVLGYSSPHEPIDAIMGAPMTTVCNEFAKGPTQNGYGAKLENPCAYPGILAAASPWISTQLYKSRLLRYRNCIPLIVLQRDSGDGGRVRASRNGNEVVVDYAVNKADSESMNQAMQGAAKILIAAKVGEVGTGHIRDAGFHVQDGTTTVDSSDSTEYLDSIAKRGLVDHEVGIFSAHQMGTCRMTSSPLTGAVDPNGESWECDDLYVMDTSLFPTASGSNPMVTVLTLSHILSTRLNLLLQLRNSSNDDSANTTEGDDKDRKELSAADQTKAVELAKERELIRQKANYAGGYNFKSLGAIWLPVVLAIISGWMIHTNRVGHGKAIITHQ